MLRVICQRSRDTSGKVGTRHSLVSTLKLMSYVTVGLRCHYVSCIWVRDTNIPHSTDQLLATALQVHPITLA